MLVFFDSFDNMDAMTGDKYVYRRNKLNYAYAPISGSVSIAAGQGKSFNGLDGGVFMPNGEYITVALSEASTYTGGGWLKLDDAAGTIVGTLFVYVRSDETPQFNLDVNEFGMLTLVVNGVAVATSDPGVIQFDGVWQHIEIYAAASASVGAICVRINETFVLSYFGPTYSPDTGSGDALVGGIRFAGVGDTHWDSIYVTTPGGPNSAFLGMAEASVVVPTGAGDGSEWTVNDPTSTYVGNWDIAARRVLDPSVGEPISDVFLYTTTFGHPTDTYVMDTFPSLGVVRSVQAGAYMAEGRIPLAFNGADSEIIVRYGGTNHVFYSIYGVDVFLSTWPNGSLDIDPETGVAWTVSSIASKEFGLHKAGDVPSSHLRMYHFSVEALFGGNPAPACAAIRGRKPWSQILDAYSH